MLSFLKPSPLKNKNSIKKRLLNFREKQKQHAFISMCKLSTQATANETGSTLTVALLRDDVHRSLLELMRLMRTTGGRFLNPNVDDIGSVHLTSDAECNYAFLWAAYLGRLDFLRRFHEECGAGLAFSHPRERYNALHLAALSGSVECVQWLLSKGGHTQYTFGGLSPLHFAAYGNSVRICRYLIESGCKIDATTLHAAVYSGSEECVRFLLHAGCPLNEYDDAGRCAVHAAADLGSPDILEMLLATNEVNVNAETVSQRLTALHIACENGYLDCTQILLQYGANINAVCAKGRTPLHLVCKLAYVDCVELLLERGAKVNVQDEEGRTPLHRAISNSPWSMHIVRMLVEHNEANINIGDKFGYTALHIAALEELEKCVEYLIENGANVAATTKGNVTALNIINRKTPASLKMLPKRLAEFISYKEQSLKLNFRDILQNSTIGETGYLHTLQHEGQERVLEHPLCKAFLHLKWQKVRFYILLRVGLSITAATLLSLLVLVCITKGCSTGIRYQRLNRVCGNLTMGECSRNFTVLKSKYFTDIFENECTDLPLHNCSITKPWAFDFVHCNESTLGAMTLRYPRFIDIAWHVIVMFLSVNVIRILLSLPAYKPITNFLNYINLLELVMTFSILILWVFWFTDVEKKEARIPMGASAVLSSWSYLTLTIGHLPFFGTHIAIFLKVLKEFMKMICAFFCLLIGFTFTFCVLKGKIFENPVMGFVRIVGMMTGELNLDSFAETKEAADYTTLEYTTVFVLWLFMFLVTIVLMNLLVGIAVNDVEGLRKTADLYELIEQTKLIYFIEVACFQGYFHYFPKCIPMVDILRRCLYIWPDSYTVVMYVRPLNPHENRLPKDIMDEAVNVAIERTTARSKKNDKTPTVDQRIDKLEKQIVKLQDMIVMLDKSMQHTSQSNSRIDDAKTTEESSSPCDEDCVS